MARVAVLTQSLPIPNSQPTQGGSRVDGRQPGELRPISCQAGMMARCVHGSALFTRGETQALATATVGHDRDIGQVRHACTHVCVLCDRKRVCV